jgi:hypothetical protein
MTEWKGAHDVTHGVLMSTCTATPLCFAHASASYFQPQIREAPRSVSIGIVVYISLFGRFTVLVVDGRKLNPAICLLLPLSCSSKRMQAAQSGWKTLYKLCRADWIIGASHVSAGETALFCRCITSLQNYDRYSLLTEQIQDTWFWIAIAHALLIFKIYTA